MAWLLSRFRAGDLVEVRSKEEILATLDQHGCVDGMPFMPEMLQYCGRRVRVRAVAHKTCDTITQTRGRRINSAVHLADLRCDGSVHGGCQAECTLFWKDVWLKPADKGGRGSTPPGVSAMASGGGCTETQLLAQTRQADGAAGEAPRYTCQATKLVLASEALPWRDLRQYLFDVVTRNNSIGHALRTLWLASLRQALWHTPFGYRLLEWLYDAMHRLLTGRPSPFVTAKIGPGMVTPTRPLDLKAGEAVRIRSKSEIEETLDASSKNRGLSFDKEMVPYCGRVVKVRRSVTRIIDESTGAMRHMKQPCIMLEGVVCNAEYTSCRLMCPRAIPSYWREIWLERVQPERA